MKGPIRYTKLGRLTTLPVENVHFGERPSVSGFLRNMMPGEALNTASINLRQNPTVESMRQGLVDMSISAARARKPADGVPLGIIDKVREFIHFHAPKVNLPVITDMLQSAKVPLLAAVGIATAAGIAYLAYKVYKNRHNISNAANKLMEDIKSAAPNLMKVPGWFENVKKSIVDNMTQLAGQPAKLIDKLAEIRSAVIGHQSTIGNVGTGINIIRNYKQGRSGAGLKVPLRA